MKKKLEIYSWYLLYMLKPNFQEPKVRILNYCVQIDDLFFLWNKQIYSFEIFCNEKIKFPKTYFWQIWLNKYTYFSVLYVYIGGVEQPY